MTDYTFWSRGVVLSRRRKRIASALDTAEGRKELAYEMAPAIRRAFEHAACLGYSPAVHKNWYNCI